MKKEDCCKVYGCIHCPLDNRQCGNMNTSDIENAVKEYEKQFPRAKHPKT